MISSLRRTFSARHFFRSLLATILFGFFSTTIVEAGEIPSCTAIADIRSSAGASPPCAPQIMDNDAAFKVVGITEKINYRYYVFVSEREWQNLSYAKRWTSLASVVSAIQSLYDENSEVFVVTTPISSLQKTLGDFSKDKIKAQARYMWPETMALKQDDITPAGHKRRLYTLIVY